MSSFSRTEPSDVSAAAVTSGHEHAPREDLDAEDRRWALEWARRNVED